MAARHRMEVSEQKREQGDNPDQELLQQAKDDWQRVDDFERPFRKLYIEDVKFNLGDSDNGWQWPDDLRRNREKNKRPALTINKTQRHVALITNDARQNKPSITVRPANGDASFKPAQIYEDLMRNIEYISKAQDIYDDATDSQVEGGIGYWRIDSYFDDAKSFDQSLRLCPVRNHLSVYLGPDIKEKDGSDAKFGFVFDEITKKEFNRLYPNHSDALTPCTGIGDDHWVSNDSVRIAEYYVLRETEDELYWIEPDQEGGDPTIFLASEAPENFKDSLIEGKYKKRKTTRTQLCWYKIAGHKVIERREDLKGKYIPLVRVVGIEKVVEGKLERKGFVRALKDPQRMYNYNSSGQVEFGALQTKVPYVGAAAAFEGNETAWNNANLMNYAFLTFNHLDEEGNPLPPEALPQRVQPPASSSAMLEGMKIAAAEMEMVSGQYAAQQGQPSNEKSGKAIAERQRQSDVATYLFVNNLAIAIRYTGMILIDLIPHYYDTKRIIQIMGKDGVQSNVTIDPSAKEAFSSTTENDIQNVLFNPAVGKYHVQADVGPAYATQRQEAWNAFVQIVTGAPALIEGIGDLMFRAADFPMADKIAERLRRKIAVNAPYLLQDGGTTPQLTQLTEALKQAQGQVGELTQKLAEKNLELKNKDREAETHQYEAESHRLTAETNSIVDLQNSQVEMKKLLEAINTTLAEMKNPDDNSAAEPRGDKPGDEETSIPGSEETNEVIEDNDLPPVPGAIKGKDGNWYHERDGQQFRVM